MNLAASGKAKLLLVEDDPDSGQLLEVALERAGFNVLRALDGAAGLSAFYDALSQGEPFTVLVLDIAMSPVDGATVARRVRRHEQDKGGRALILGYTAYGSMLKTVVAEDDIAQFDEILFKPNDGELLIKTLNAKLHALAELVPPESREHE